MSFSGSFKNLAETHCLNFASRDFVKNLHSLAENENRVEAKDKNRSDRGSVKSKLNEPSSLAEEIVRSE